MFWRKHREEVIRLQKKQVALLQILVDSLPSSLDCQTARLKQSIKFYEPEKD